MVVFNKIGVKPEHIVAMMDKAALYLADSEELRAVLTQLKFISNKRVEKLIEPVIAEINAMIEINNGLSAQILQDVQEYEKVGISAAVLESP